MTHIDRVLGICLIHATGTTPGLLGSLKDKVIKFYSCFELLFGYSISACGAAEATANRTSSSSVAVIADRTAQYDVRYS